MAVVFVTLSIGWQNNFASQVRQANDGIAEADQEEGPRNLLKEACVQHQTWAMHCELGFLTDRLELEGMWIESLIQSLDEKVKASVDQMSSETQSLLLGSGRQHLDSALREHVWNELEGNLSAEQKLAFDKLKSSFAEMQQLADRTAINTALVILDNELCLSEAQLDKLGRLYQEKWNSNFNGHCLQLANGAELRQSHPIISKFHEQIKGLLTKKQQQAFLSLGECSNQLRTLLQLALADEYQNAQAARRFCELVMELKLDEYERLVELDDLQMKSLRIASKGAVDRVVKEFDEFFLGIDMESMNMQVFIFLREAIILKCTREVVWEKTLAKVLNKGQLQTVNDRETVRRAKSFENASNSLALAISESVDPKFDSEQFLQVSEAIRNQFGESLAPSCSSLLEELPRVPDEVFQEILTDHQWQKFKPILDRGRAKMWKQEQRNSQRR